MPPISKKTFCDYLPLEYALADGQLKQEAHGPHRSPENNTRAEDKISSNLLFQNYLPLKLGKGLNPDHPRMLSAKFG